jgi:hypothetical protein
MTDISLEELIVVLQNRIGLIDKTFMRRIDDMLEIIIRKHAEDISKISESIENIRSEISDLENDMEKVWSDIQAMKND